jgi:hypothetical protein
VTRLAAFGTLLTGLTLAALSLHVPGEGSVGTPERYRAVVAILCASACAYLACTALTLRARPARHAIWIVLAVAAAMRLPLLLSPPFLSSDIYRYVWDGRVQAAGLNPYCCVPGDPALAPLRDQAVFPHINRGDYAPTIYPPAAQVLFAAAAQILPGVAGMKWAMVLCEAAAMLCLSHLLAIARLPPERLLIYAWNPLPVWAFAGNGHIDAAVIGWVAAALLLRCRGRDGWAGLALGAAVATKFLPAVIAPALWRGRWRLGFAAAAAIAALYALYIGAGWKVLGFLAGYGREEGLDTGEGFWALAALRRLVALPGFATQAYLAAAVLLLAALGCWFAFVRRPAGPVAVCAAAATMMAALTFAVSPHYPWYFAWLSVPAVLAPSPALLWLAAAPVLIYLDTYNDFFAWPTAVYAPALLLALLPLRIPGPAPAPIEGRT